MPRSHGKVLASIWVDPDWVALTSDAQRLYVLLLSQPKLTLAGSLDLYPKRWAKLSADSTEETIDAALTELEAAGFIVRDGDTDELVIRSFTSYDMAPGRANSNLVKGFWSAWCGIASSSLRAVVVRNMPDELWVKALPFAPSIAEHLRRSAPSKPDVPTASVNGQSKPDVATGRPNPLPPSVFPPAVVEQSESEPSQAFTAAKAESSGRIAQARAAMEQAARSAS